MITENDIDKQIAELIEDNPLIAKIYGNSDNELSFLKFALVEIARQEKGYRDELIKDIIRKNKENEIMIKGQVRDMEKNLYNWTLTSNVSLLVQGAYNLTIKLDAEEITTADQVIRLIDNEVAIVNEYRIGNGQWRLYR